MDPMLLGALVGAGTGLVKHGEDQRQAKRARKREAEVARFSPWTGMYAQRVEDPSLMGNLMAGGTTGLMMGQNIENSMMRRELARQAMPGEAAAPMGIVPSDAAVGMPTDQFNYQYGGPYHNIGLALNPWNHPTYG